jgi:hypothetical protein
LEMGEDPGYGGIFGSQREEMGLFDPEAADEEEDW